MTTLESPSEASLGLLPRCLARITRVGWRPEEIGRVVLAPVFRDLSAGQAIDLNGSDSHSSVARGHTEELPLMGAGMRKSHSDLVSCCKHIVDGQLAVRHPFLQMLCQLNEAVGVLSEARWRAVGDEVGRQVFPHRALISGFECLKSSLHNLLVAGSVCGHQVPLKGRVCDGDRTVFIFVGPTLGSPSTSER